MSWNVTATKTKRLVRPAAVSDWQTMQLALGELHFWLSFGSLLVAQLAGWLTE